MITTPAGLKVTGLIVTGLVPHVVVKWLAPFPLIWVTTAASAVSAAVMLRALMSLWTVANATVRAFASTLSTQPTDSRDATTFVMPAGDAATVTLTGTEWEIVPEMPVRVSVKVVGVTFAATATLRVEVAEPPA